MPIYEYQCQTCGYEFDKLQKMSDERLTDCPDCNKPDLKKLVSAPSFKLKGTGWYESDFKNSGTKASKVQASEVQASEAKATGTNKKSSAAKTAKTSSSSCATGGCACH